MRKVNKNDGGITIVWVAGRYAISTSKTEQLDLVRGNVEKWTKGRGKTTKVCLR